MTKPKEPNEKFTKAGSMTDGTFWSNLTNEKLDKPRRYSAKNRFAKSVEKELEEKTNAASQDEPKKKRVSLWQRELDSMWKVLSEEQQKEWQQQSDTAYNQEVEAWKKAMVAPISKKPEDLQRYAKSLLVS